jgi:uncharacterized phage protein (TIGR02218 family)
MTDLRVGQAPVLVVSEVNPDMRVFQAPVLAIGSVAPPLHVFQTPVLIVSSVFPDLNVFQTPILVVASSSPCGTRWAQFWTIVRTDGEIYRFTSLDTDFTLDGNVYQACDSLVPSASEAVSQVDAGGTMDLSGAIGEDGISEADLYGGLYDGATVEAWLAPWDGEGSRRRLLKGTFGPIDQMPTGFKVELQGDGEKLKQTPLVSTLEPGCRWVFGDENCQKDLTALTVIGTVDSGTGQRSFVDAARAEAAGYFSRGKVTFTTGSNAGVSAEIKEHTAGGTFVLWPRLRFPVVAGDQYEMTPGCTNLKESSGGTNGCTAWANFVNYGGFLDVPTKDKLASAAVVKDS